MPERPTALIMAAGWGTRMRSSLPKVLHPVCGRPMLDWVIAAARDAGAGRVVCVTRPGDGVAARLPEGVESVEQTSGEGTGSAVLAARDRLEPQSTVLILSGDHPLLSASLITELIAAHELADAAATMLTTEGLDPAGYGRVVRAVDGSVERIVETKTTEGVPAQELAIREINLGAYAFAAGDLLGTLDSVGVTDGERYLTAVFPILIDGGRRVIAHRTTDVLSAIGVNTRADLIEVERHARRRLIEAHALAGVSFSSPETTTIDFDVEIGEDTRIEPGVSLRRGTRIGRGCTIGPQTTIAAATIADGVSARHSYLFDCEVEAGATIGPFAYLRPGASVGAGAKVGAFVELKNSRIGAGAKVPHLSYIGDADVGEGANVGAGNITANYDGRRKHRTVIGKGARTGVDTSFVAPVRVGDGAYTGAGSVITGDVPDGALGIAREKQRNIEGFAKRVEDERTE